MAQNANATFHPFPRLPAELRFQIWESAIEVRVLEIGKFSADEFGDDGYFYTRTSVPAVTRACRESRDHSSYRKAFMVDSSPRYIWTNFDYDIVRMSTYEIPYVAADNAARDSIKHLQVEIDDSPEQKQYPLENFWDSGLSIRNFTNLESCCVLVDHINWDSMTNILRDSYWGELPKKNARMVDAKTGEWIDLESCDAYRDYLDSVVGNYGLHYPSWQNWSPEQRWTQEEWAADRAETDQERREAIERLQIPLPRMKLDAWAPSKSRHS